MIKWLKQAYSKFVFCLAVSNGIKTFFLLVINSKRFNSFQKNHTTDIENQLLPIRYSLQLGSKKRTIYLRTYAGDIKMFYEIFWERVYRMPASFQANNGIIVDAGANIGMAGLYFSLRFPHANVYCIEPAAENFRLLKMNLEGEIENGKVNAIQAALYSRDGTTGINNSGWAYNASVDDTATHSVTAITINTFFRDNKLEKIDLLKIDIEGAEEFIFLSGTGWLQKVNTILIEIHSPELISTTKETLLQAGFYWYEWNFTASSNNIFLAAKTPVTADEFSSIAKS
jgi:FkbM family methyltransferase